MEYVIIGHSFGAAAVYSALESIAIERISDAQRHTKPVRPVGDQVILLNPAFEALRYHDLDEMARGVSNYPIDQRPVLTILQSQGDWATHYFFPIGRFFATLFESHRDDQQRLADIRAVGWYGSFQTHKLVFDPSAKLPTTVATTMHGKYSAPTSVLLQSSISSVQQQRVDWTRGGQSSRPYTFDHCRLEPEKGIPERDPFLVAAVDKQIMEDHNDIQNPKLIRFIEEYIQFCQSDPTDYTK